MAVKKSSRASERRERRKRDILDTASRLFVQRGYESVTLRAIAEELGYAHAALYRYFPDKFSVLAEICRQTFAQLQAEVSDLQLQPGDRQVVLFETSRHFVAFALKHPHHFRTVFMGSGDWGEVESGQYIDAVGRECFAALVQTFQAAWASRHKTDGLLQAHTWWVSLFGTAQVFLVSGEDAHLSDRQSLLELQMAALWQGLKKASNKVLPERAERKLISTKVFDEKPPHQERSPHSGQLNGIK